MPVMTSKIRILLKIICFLIVFFAISGILAFFLKDDSNSYARVLRHEFHNQQKIDFLFSGASHTSHGINPQIADKVFNKSVFNLGTPAQQIDGTCVLLKQAVKLYKIEKVFLELDFNIATSFSIQNRHGFTASYIVLDFLKDPELKYDFMLNMSRPEYYLNTLLPIGKDKFMDLNPKKVAAKFKSVVSGKYFKYEYNDKKSFYAGKGCVLDTDFFENGSIYTTEKEDPIKLTEISDTWKNSVAEIIRICQQNDIELVLYSMPATDFYLNAKGNYDEYFDFVRQFAAQYGYDYFDFNLCKENFLNLEDKDFSDDNHLNMSGVQKFTESFCKFFTGKISREDAFYQSYSKKMKNQKKRIFGLQLITAEDHKSLEIIPLSNNVSPEEITYDVCAVFDGNTEILGERTSESTVVFPKSGFGQLMIKSYVNGIQNNEVVSSYIAF